MYAEERQQAMAQLISQQGRLSVVELAEEFEVTTETVRRDLSALERIGLIRRVHGGAVPASTLAVIESGISERDMANTDAKDAIAPAALALLPRPAPSRHRRRLHDGEVRRRAAARPPADRGDPRGARRRPPGRPAPDRALPAARSGAARHPRRGRRRDRGRAVRAAGRRIVRRDQRAQPRPWPLHPRSRRGRHQARDHRLRPARPSCSPTPPSSAWRPPCASPRSTASTCW